MNVVSYFDGYSSGNIALDRLGIDVDNYFAYEIEKAPIEITQRNYPNTKQMGSVVNADLNLIPRDEEILLIGGSPCQGFSIAGKKLNFDDERSKLFFEFVRAKNELKPKYFFLENVRMPDNIADAIDQLMGVKRQYVNSRFFTGHIRKRYYWTNLPLTELPKTDIKIKDVIDLSLPFNKDMNFFYDRTPYAPTISSDGIITVNPKQNGGKQTWQRGRVYDIEGNCPTICASLFDLNITKDHKTYRKLTINECEALQGVPKDYTKGVSKQERGKMLGNGWNIDTVMHFFNGLKSQDGRKKN